jgi:hypothetical protein
MVEVVLSTEEEIMTEDTMAVEDEDTVEEAMAVAMEEEDMVVACDITTMVVAEEMRTFMVAHTIHIHILAITEDQDVVMTIPTFNHHCLALFCKGSDDINQDVIRGYEITSYPHQRSKWLRTSQSSKAFHPMLFG